jgi:hypothetical protein
LPKHTDEAETARLKGEWGDFGTCGIPVLGDRFGMEFQLVLQFVKRATRGGKDGHQGLCSDPNRSRCIKGPESAITAEQI